MTERFDAIVIGTGQAGPSLAVRLATAGRKTAIIERKLIGGTCVNNGCIPTKTLIASARAAYVARRGGDFGVTIDAPIRVDMAEVKKRKDSVVRHSTDGLTRWLGETSGLTMIEGHARFEAPKTLRVGDRLLEAKQIVINVSCDEEPREIAGTHVLLAVGRVPNTDDLGLDKAGIATDARGYITVDDQLRTNVPGIWALGDVNGRGAFTHTSYNDYEIVAANLLDRDPRRVTDRIPAYALFVDPPLGRAGTTEREVRASERKALVGKIMMARVGRARERSETQGFMQVLV